MSVRRKLGLPVALYITGLCIAGLCIAACAVPGLAAAQSDDPPVKHGRKYKAPPETAHIEVIVTKSFNKKPIMNAAVVFHSVKDGRDEGNLEVKTDSDGKAVIDVIPMGSGLRVQVIADGFSTFAEDYLVDKASRQIFVSMVRPQAQVSTYQDNSGKASERPPGVQEPIRSKAKPAPPAAPPAPPPAPPPPPQN